MDRPPVPAPFAPGLHIVHQDGVEVLTVDVYDGRQGTMKRLRYEEGNGGTIQDRTIDGWTVAITLADPMRRLTIRHDAADEWAVAAGETLKSKQFMKQAREVYGIIREQTAMLAASRPKRSRAA